MKTNRVRAEHQRISQALIENDTSYLIAKYGCIKTAQNKLIKLDYFLNYGEWK